MQVKNVELFESVLEQTHTLIAGTTGSGKSVLLNGIMYQSLLYHPDHTYILIDPKRSELYQYRSLKRCIMYACEPETMIQALEKAIDLIESRQKKAMSKGLKSYGSPVYVVIDELADLMTTCRKQAMPLIQRIGQVGRSSNVHLIACTQCPLARVIPTEILVNLDARIGLRTRARQDSVNIFKIPGVPCEELPRFGYGYYMNPRDVQIHKVKIPYIPDSEITEAVKLVKKTEKPWNRLKVRFA